MTLDTYTSSLRKKLPRNRLSSRVLCPGRTRPGMNFLALALTRFCNPVLWPLRGFADSLLRMAAIRIVGPVSARLMLLAALE